MSTRSPVDRPEVPADSRDDIERLCRVAFGPNGPEVGRIEDANQGRGAFSLVLRIELEGGAGDSGPTPASAVAKLPMPGPNGQAARDSGAYRREALAYRDLLPYSPIAHPRCLAVLSDDAGGASFLLEDLTPWRFADQIAGLTDGDALAVARSLAELHRVWSDPDRLDRLPVRRNTVAGFDPAALAAGLDVLAERWSDVVDGEQRRAFADLVAAQRALAAGFRAEPPTLCHGDPRADNLAFDPVTGRPIVFDWQQVAVQFAEADLAWLAATSLTVDTRRRIEAALVAEAGGRLDRYRLGLALPGLAVLLLAQRELASERARRFVAVSLGRIAAALADNNPTSLVT